MRGDCRRLLIAGFAAAATSAALIAQAPPSSPDERALVERARGIHARVITLDTHVDINPAHFVQGCNYTRRLTTQVNLPKMREGGLDAAFFIVYVGQGPLTPAGYDDAYQQAIAKFDAVHRLTEQIAPSEIGLALTPTDARGMAASGRAVAIIGVENGYPIGTDITRVQEFYARGARYLSLAHNGHNQLSDSNTGENTKDAPNGGISPLGRQVIAELNRLGIMVDVSHPSKASMLQAAELSRAPIIASHSAVRALANHSRNMDDEQLLALKKNGGVIQMVAFANYVKVQPAAAGRAGARGASPTTVGATGASPTTVGATGANANAVGASPTTVGATGARGASPTAVGATGANATAVGANTTPVGARGASAPIPGGRGTAISIDCPVESPDAPARTPVPGRANVKDFVDHIDYAVKKIGIDHVGISSDFDGGGGIEGWSSAAETFNVTLELVRRGYSEADIAKLWSGNLLRVWGEVEQVARRLQAEAK